MNALLKKNCPCCSGHSFKTFCEPYIKGKKKPASPEILMRSRYTAYTIHDVAYIKKTMIGPSLKEFNLASAKQWAQESEWKGLEILSSQISEDQQTGTVEFVAHYASNNKDKKHHEISTFHFKKEKWVYYDGHPPNLYTYERETRKLGRNEPCPCGSGKKYKKCCL